MSPWGNTMATNEIGMSIEMFKVGDTTGLELLGKAARRRLDLSGPVKEGEALGRRAEVHIRNRRGQEQRCGDVAPPPRTSPRLTYLCCHTWLNLWLAAPGAVLTLNQVAAATSEHE